MSPLERTLAAFDAASRASGSVAWGTFDCLRFALCGAGRADLIETLVPDYSSQRQAIRALRARGYATLADAIDSIGARVGAPLPGDIGFVDQPPVGALGLVVGREALFLKPGGGLHPLHPRIVWRLAPCPKP